MKKTFLALIGALIVVGLAGCSSSEYSRANSDAADVTYSSAKSNPNAAARGNSYAGGESAYQQNGAPMHTAARQPDAQRAVIHSANMGLDVDKLSEAEKGMKKVVKENGGFIVDLQSAQQEGQLPTLRLTLRVPEKNFEDTMTALEDLGFATYKNISASDITEDILFAEARLQQLQQGMVKVNGIVTDHTDEIKQVRTERDQLMMRASMSTIELVMQQKPNAAMMASSSWGSDTWNAALSSAMTAFRVIGAVAIWLLVYSPIWGVIVAAGIWAVRHSKRQRVVA